jgi:hypothetical protein
MIGSAGLQMRWNLLESKFLEDEIAAKPAGPARVAGEDFQIITEPGSPEDRIALKAKAIY